MARSLAVVALVSLLLSACSTTHTSPDSPANDAPPAPSAVQVVAAPRPSAPAVVTATAPAPVASAVASAPAPAASSAAAAPVGSAAPDESPLPKVKVTNIGMHIGGGPNDDATKEPIRSSVAPHFDEFRRCWALADGQKGDVSIDLRIDREGGKAKVSPPKVTIKSKPFAECVVKTFEGIDFRKPRGGTTNVSYSLHFAP
jgi:pyruvate/2-oxoglutarate dehydrogenase complex dihydrolipoamide acyltransferase (E2) component